MTKNEFNTTLIELINQARPKVAVVQELLMHSPTSLSDDAFDGVFMMLEAVHYELREIKSTISSYTQEQAG